MIEQNKKYALLQIDWHLPSVKALIFTNIITIVWAIIGAWSVATVVWIYWAQSVIIGIFQAKKMLDLKNFSTEGFKFNGRPVPPTKAGKLKIVAFFLFHYGFFHFIYFIFLAQVGKSVIWNSVLIASTIFFINHLFSYIINKEKDSKKIKNIGKMMFFPYARIMPMHLIILFGLFLLESPVVLVIFMSLKTFADVIMHVTEHKL